MTDHPAFQVLIKIKDQEIPFNSQSFPYYLVGWERNGDFFDNHGEKIENDSIEDWIRLEIGRLNIL
jgi:hypothetical protein